MVILLRLYRVKTNPFLQWADSQERNQYSAQEVQAILEKIARPCLRLEKTGVGSEVGGSKLGGMPDLPNGTPWPEFKGKPLSFIAQIRLSDLQGQSLAAALPQTGMLSFFYDQDQRAWGFNPKDKGFSRILFTPSEEGLLRRPAPQGLPPEACFREVAVRFQERPSYPTEEEGAFEGVPEDLKNLCQDRIQVGEGNDPQHQLLGCENLIQGDIKLECQLVTHGLYCGNASGYNDPRAKELEKGAKEWKLLLQIDSDDQLNMMWGDAGRLYYCATEDMLRERRFEDTWMIFQCG